MAIDAVAAQMMGFDPMKIQYIVHATERGLGQGDPRQIEIVGQPELADERWGFTVRANLGTGTGMLLWRSPLKVFQKLLFHTPLVNVFIFASETYHDKLWYPLKGQRVAVMLAEMDASEAFAAATDIAGVPCESDDKSMRLLTRASQQMVDDLVFNVVGHLVQQARQARVEGAFSRDTQRVEVRHDGGQTIGQGQPTPTPAGEHLDGAGQQHDHAQPGDAELAYQLGDDHDEAGGRPAHLQRTPRHHADDDARVARDAL